VVKTISKHSVKAVSTLVSAAEQCCVIYMLHSVNFVAPC
jgi:hypothetical protein